MPIVNSIAGMAKEMAGWRQHLHANPELGFDCHDTAAFVADRLREFGVDAIHEGIATSGIVALIHGQGDGPVIGLRADMDALPIEEATGAAHASQTPGKMHACGHDGHTTMLLGAAKYLAETRQFSGTVALIFQPAEEMGGGGKVMVDEGIMDRFDIASVYALHTAPNFPLGQFYTTPGPIMASVDDFRITVTGAGGHGAFPEFAIDPIPAALAIAQSIQTIVSRNTPASQELVISVTQFNAGSATNIIPDDAVLAGTIRAFDAAMTDLALTRIRAICDGQAAAFGVKVDLQVLESYPATINSAAETTFASDVAAEIVGEEGVKRDAQKEMGAEDFSYMLNVRPGSYLFLGQGPGATWHHPEFDFNDDAAPYGASFFARLVETAQPVEG